MVQSDRQSEILRIARREGEVSVDGLAARLGVSVQTVRRDLGDLAGAGFLDRQHGGAVLASGTRNIAYDARRALNERAKARIADAAAALVPERASLFLNIGTTTEAVARALIGRPGLMIVTNNLNVATTLGRQPETEVILTGGTLRGADNGLLGPEATEAVARYRVDVAVIGCSAIDGAGTLLDFDGAEVAVSRAMIAHARAVILVADASKLRRKAPVAIGRLGDLDTWVTDAEPPASLRQTTPDTRIVVAR